MLRQRIIPSCQYDEDEEPRPGSLNEAERAKSGGIRRSDSDARGEEGDFGFEVLFDFPFDFLGAAPSTESTVHLWLTMSPHASEVLKPFANTPLK
jgi:hypothetical protein